ncbi:hypothetical protein [Pelosinus baikalensis]|uniref:Uncharacterized protein n=1 Tax=Pelosinus baikalensis TaxID=2892015 RepID=A0ABS8HRS9_9FIRM|nr:hypothetical protein [Pelosinus baikalensis]MCC5464792.1 hypothetical protein [Pelosinus baikalensis]
MKKNLMMQQSNAKLQTLLETALDFAMLITNGDQGKFEVFRRVMLNKYNALKKINSREINGTQECKQQETSNT